MVGWKTLKEFIEAHTVEKGCDFTHTSLSSPASSFYVPAEHLEQFYKLYEEAIKKGEDLHITEKNRHIGPVVVDLDLRWPLPVPVVPLTEGVEGEIQAEIQPQEKAYEKLYNLPVIQSIVQIYAESIQSFLTPKQNYDIYVMEKPGPTVYKQLLKDGIHLVVPDIVTKASVKHLIRRDVLSKLKPIMDSIGVSNPIHDVVDESIIERNNWFMYGSKKRGSEPYTVSHVYQVDYTNVSGGGIEEKEADEKSKEEIKEKGARLFSIRNKHREVPINAAAQKKIDEFEAKEEEARRNLIVNKKIVGTEVNQKVNYYENIEQIERLVDLLSHDRVDRYDDWMRLGWCLRNIDNRLVDKWEQFSSHSRKYKTGECARVWIRMREGGLGIGSLHLWAKADNPTGYAELMKTDLKNLLYQSTSGTEYDVAKVVHQLYQHDFVCGSYKHKCWYEFRNHRWVITDTGVGLRVKLSDDVWKKYKEESVEYTHRAVSTTNNQDQQKAEEISKKLMEISYKLRKSSFKENVMKECSELFYVDKFEERLDSNTHLIGFLNGVYDLERHEFRNGRPDDYISFCTWTNYMAYDPTHSVSVDVNAYLEQVLTNNAVRDYVLKLFATFVSGQIKEQKFYIWTGSGSNSKSKLVELFEKSMGDYCCKFPITLLTQKRTASNAANSELARAKGKRFACLQEPGEDERINIGLMKELSGGDKIMARALFKEPIEFYPQFKMLLLCNQLPHVPSDDGGTWRRIRVVEFTSKFVEVPNPEDPNEFPIDYSLGERMEGWYEYFSSLLIHMYRKYQIEGLTEPAEVMRCTTEYKSQNDHMSHFILTHLEKKDGAFIPLDELHTELRGWLKNDSIPIRLMSKPDLDRYLSKNLTKSTMHNHVRGYKGYQLRSTFPANATLGD